MQDITLAHPLDNRRPTLEAIPRQSDENGGGVIFGGWTLSYMDIAAGKCAFKEAKQRVTTVGVDKMRFIKPVFVGDPVCFYTKLHALGTTSLTIEVDVFSHYQSKDLRQVAIGLYSFVALDEHRKPAKLKLD